MIATIVVVFIAVALLVAVRAVLRTGLPGQGEDEIQPVHLPAVLNLLDERQIDYLREKLSARDFARVQRQRHKVLLVYVKRIAANAAVLMRFAHGASQAGDPEVAASGRELLQYASETRMQALRAIALLYGRLIVPGGVRQLGGTVVNYSKAKDRFVLLAKRTRTEVETSA